MQTLKCDHEIFFLHDFQACPNNGERESGKGASLGNVCLICYFRARFFFVPFVLLTIRGDLTIYATIIQFCGVSITLKQINIYLNVS